MNGPTDEWINKMWNIYTVQYYLSIKRNEVLTCATTWISPENLMRSERSQSQKNYIGFHLYQICRISKYIAIEGRLVASGLDSWGWW